MSRDINSKHPRTKPTGNRFELLQVCVNHADFLEHTLPHNKQFFDNVVIVTSFEDKATHNVCRYNNVECVKTDVFFEDGADFAKAHGINLGLAHLKYADHILHADADILLPGDFRNLVFSYPIQKDVIYGADRINIVGRKAYEELIRTHYVMHQYRDKFLSEVPPESERGARLIHKEMGYVPIGFFQLFHGDYLRKHQLRYPDNQVTAERTDVLFSLQWPRAKRILLPTATVFHLESERSNQGTNWHGRKSKPF